MTTCNECEVEIDADEAEEECDDCGAILCQECYATHECSSTPAEELTTVHPLED